MKLSISRMLGVRVRFVSGLVSGLASGSLSGSCPGLCVINVRVCVCFVEIVPNLRLYRGSPSD